MSVTHLYPFNWVDGGDGLMPCCGKTPFDVPRTDRITLDARLVTCGVISQERDTNG